MGRGFDDLREYHALVKEAGRQGADFIKIMTTGLLDFNNHGMVTGTPLEKEEVREMVHIAHEEGFAVMSHTNGVCGAQAAIEAGVDSLEHGNYMDDETIAMLADSHTVWVPTLVTVRNLMGCGRYDDTVLQPIIESGETSLRRAFHKKARVALGSDAGAYRVMHGTGIRDEYRAFLEILGDTPDTDRWIREGEEEIPPQVLPKIKRKPGIQRNGKNSSVCRVFAVCMFRRLQSSDRCKYWSSWNPQGCR